MQETELKSNINISRADLLYVTEMNRYPLGITLEHWPCWFSAENVAWLLFTQCSAILFSKQKAALLLWILSMDNIVHQGKVMVSYNPLYQWVKIIWFNVVHANIPYNGKTLGIDVPLTFCHIWTSFSKGEGLKVDLMMYNGHFTKPRCTDRHIHTGLFYYIDCVAVHRG